MRRVPRQLPILAACLLLLAASPRLAAQTSGIAPSTVNSGYGAGANAYYAAESFVGTSFGVSVNSTVSIAFAGGGSASTGAQLTSFVGSATALGDLAGVSQRTTVLVSYTDANMQAQSFTGVLLVNGPGALFYSSAEQGLDYRNWSVQFGGGTDVQADDDQVLALAPVIGGPETDLGSVIVAGSFRGTLTLNGRQRVNGTRETITCIQTTGSVRDLLVGQVNHRGEWLWASSSGVLAKTSEARAVALDDDRNIYVAGRSGDNLVVIKYNSSGGEQWRKEGFGVGGAAAAGLVLRQDGANVFLYLTGWYKMPFTFQGTALSGATGVEHACAAKLDGAGNLLWIKAGTGSGNKRGNAIAVDASGNVYMVAEYAQDLTFTGGSSLTNPSAGQAAALINLSADGVPQWATNLATGAGTNLGTALTLDAAGNVYPCGAFTGSASVGGQALTSAGTRDLFVVKCDSDGVPQWVQRAGGSGTVVPRGIKLYEYDTADTSVYPPTAIHHTEFYLAGGFTGSASFAAKTIAALGGSDAFAARLDVTSGPPETVAWQWANFGGGLGDDQANAVTFDSFGLVTIGGRFSGIAGFDYSFFSAQGSEDAFVAKIPRTTGAFLSEFWVVGKSIPRPEDAPPFRKADGSQGVTLVPEIEILNDPKAMYTDYFFFSTYNGELFAKRPSTANIKWRTSNDIMAQERVPVIGSADWPVRPQIHVAGVPVDVKETDKSIGFTSQVAYHTSGSDAAVATDTFTCTAEGFAVLHYFVSTSPNSNITSNQSLFTVVRTVLASDLDFYEERGWDIGATLGTLDPSTDTTYLTFYAQPFTHQDVHGKNAYIFDETRFYDGYASAYNPLPAYDRASRQGAIIPVNLDDSLLVAWFEVNSDTGVGWPVKPVKYNCVWPTSPAKIVIASTYGSDGGSTPTQPVLSPTIYWEPAVYNQPEKGKAGYNPNEEHAIILPSNAGSGFPALFALRCDLNDRYNASKSYALLKYWNAASEQWAMKVYQVVAEDATYTFHYNGKAGTKIDAPYPLSILPKSPKSTLEGLAGYKDYKGDLWAQAQGPVVGRFFYPLQPGFYPEQASAYYTGASQATDTTVPWLDRLPSGSVGTPVTVNYTLYWPDATDLPAPLVPEVLPVLRVGETLLTPKNGLPNIKNQAAVTVLYERKDGESGKSTAASLVRVFRPLDPVTIGLKSDGVSRWLAAIPSDIATTTRAGKIIPSGTADGTTKLPYTSRCRISYDPVSLELSFKGVLDEARSGDPLLLLNVMSSKERDALKALSSNSGWKAAITELYNRSRDGLTTPPTLGPDLALTAGDTSGTGYVTVTFNADARVTPLPITLAVFRVECAPYQGQIQVIPSDNVFDEQLVLRHSGDFGGDPSRFTFEWEYSPDDGGQPSQDWSAAHWIPLHTNAADKLGAVEICIEGASLLTLSDNWFRVRYTGYSVCSNTSTPTAWAGRPGGDGAQLAEGWIKRVVAGLNPFKARVLDFHSSPTATFVSMIRQAGKRYEGPIAFNPGADSINSIGLIEAYETVLRRGMALSVDATPAVSYTPANAALLNVASRICDLYMLLGNEAYGDAADPTIGFGTKSGEYGTMAPSIFAFQNQVASLLDEELVLLRGRDESNASVRARPAYNRFYWNFTNGEGEVAYSQVYNVKDENGDGVIDALDAMVMFPQGHGDAWGHYLTAITTYYKLLRHPNYGWSPQAEAVLVAGSPVQVDYLDERKFALAAAAKAKTGAEVVNLTYRSAYVEDPAGQWQGYKDSTSSRGWGVDEWARRAGQGAYFDWLVGNAILPATDPNPAHTGIQKVDRTTVLELSEIVAAYGEVAAQVDKGDRGLSPLGLVKGVVPFDIDPALLADGKTHFEQIYDRAVEALNNAVTMFDYANQSAQMLRRNQDSLAEMQKNVSDQERDYVNRLIEIFGYPYSDDMGPGKTYPAGFSGPDLYHYMYIDSTELTGSAAPSKGAKEIKGYFKKMADGNWTIQQSGSTVTEADFDPNSDGIAEITYSVSSTGFGAVKPATWTGKRRAPGELQRILSDFYQARARFQKAQRNYENLIWAIGDQVSGIQSTKDSLDENISIMQKHKNAVSGMNGVMICLQAAGLAFRTVGTFTDNTGDAVTESIPKVVGLAIDVTAPIRGTIKAVSNTVSDVMNTMADVTDTSQNIIEFGKEIAEQQTSIDLQTNSNNFVVQQQVWQLEAKIREEPGLRLECYNLKEALSQVQGNYLAKLAEGERVIEELVAFRQRTAGTVQEYRYQDMAFRVFRNDAIQKYRAQFDLAARYVYLAATAYDYETNMLYDAGAAGQRFLNDIVRQRSLGQVLSDRPVAGSRGLADPLARMAQNFTVLKGQLGFNNPATETNRFSLRTEMFRLRENSNEAWRTALTKCRVDNVWDVPEFRRFCRPFAPESAGPQPGLVIPFTTTVTFGLNFFGWPLGGGDSAYDPTHFATRVRSVGVWFGNYNLSGLSNTPRVYLVPVGADVLRSPTGDSFATREWRVLDQKLPVPFPIGPSDVASASWIPMNDGLNDTFGGIRRFSSLRAYHDKGDFDPTETASDTRLIGRSVWNTRWLIIIPGGTLLWNADVGLDTFVNGPLVPGSSTARNGDGVDDIKIFFQTYSYSGN